MVISPYQLKTDVGMNMAANSLDAEKLVQPYIAESAFLGWSVLFTDTHNGHIIHDGRGYIWDLNQPFAYYPDNPREMDCLMIANWQSAQTSNQAQNPEILPDGRAMLRPFPIGTDPLPHTPPPAHLIVEGAKWYTSVIIRHHLRLPSPQWPRH